DVPADVAQARPVVAVLGEHPGGALEDLVASGAGAGGGSHGGCEGSPDRSVGGRALRTAQQGERWPVAGPWDRGGARAGPVLRHRRHGAPAHRQRIGEPVGHRRELAARLRIHLVPQRHQTVEVDVPGLQEGEGDAGGGDQAPGVRAQRPQRGVGVGGQTAGDGEGDLFEIEVDMDGDREGVRHDRRPFSCTRTTRPPARPPRSLYRPRPGRHHVSKDDVTGPEPTEATSSAASSRSFMLRWLEAVFSSATASSWLHRFCPMIIPTARSITVRCSIAARRSRCDSRSWAIRTASRSAFDACSTSRTIESPGPGSKSCGVAEYTFSPAWASSSRSNGTPRTARTPWSTAAAPYSGHLPSSRRSPARVTVFSRIAVMHGPSVKRFWR